jgi:hypothetical protein
VNRFYIFFSQVLVFAGNKGEPNATMRNYLYDDIEKFYIDSYHKINTSKKRTRSGIKMYLDVPSLVEPHNHWRCGLPRCTRKHH